MVEILKNAYLLLLDKEVKIQEFSVTSNQASQMNGGKDFCEWSKRDRELAGSIGKIVEFVLGKYGKGLVNLALAESFFEKGGDNYEVAMLANKGRMQAEAGAKIDGVLTQMRAAGVQNILALRGDAVSGNGGDFAHASDLMGKIKKAGDFCVGGACYPEGHPEAGSLDRDIANTRRKIDSGCDFLVTQMVFDNNIIYNYMYRLLRHGIDVPVVAGIMPVTNAKQINRICELSGTKLPANYRAIVEKFADDPEALKQAGIAYATGQIVDLIANGLKNIHVYTMNRPEIIGGIMKNLSEIVK